MSTGSHELDDMVTTAQAKEIAAELGVAIDVSTIAAAARRWQQGGDNGIEGARKLWDNEKAPWLIPRAAFVHWIKNRRNRGRPREKVA